MTRIEEGLGFRVARGSSAQPPLPVTGAYTVRKRMADSRQVRRPMFYPAKLRARRDGRTCAAAAISAALEASPECHGGIGRGSRIRTCDPLLPKQMRYQTAPCPDGRRILSVRRRAATECDDLRLKRLNSLAFLVSISVRFWQFHRCEGRRWSRLSLGKFPDLSLADARKVAEGRAYNRSGRMERSTASGSVLR
jgi:hypothetical protein